jgi:glycosyltransferase involved in cell wall biosynthesis
MKEVNPKVTVIIPTYNRAHLIKRAIKSVLNQTFQDFEIIVVDDGSTDNTEEVVKSFNDLRIKYIKHQKNLGASAARNTGIKNSKGEYIAFLDSDDEWLPEKLEKQMRYFKKIEKRRGKLGLVYCDSIWCDEEGRKIAVSNQIWKPKEGWVFKELLKNCFISTASVVICREDVLIKVGLFDRKFTQSQDYELWIRLSTFYPIAYLNLPLVKHKMWEGNVTKKRHQAIFCNIRLIHKVLKNSYTSIYNKIDLTRPMRAFLYFKIGHLLYYLDKTKKAKYWLIRSLLKNPFCVKPYFFLFLIFLNIKSNRYQIVRKKFNKFR